MTRYANILNDDAFKVVIFTPGNEELMARMIEVLIPGKKIKTLEFRPAEQHGLALSDKISNFDAVCTSDTDEMFIVEMQGLPETSYADRMLCYASFPIRLQLEQKLREISEGGHKVPMDYSLMPIYVVSIVNFKLKHERPEVLEDGLTSRYTICSPKTGELMTDSLHFVFFELGRLRYKLGEEDKCESVMEQLAYSLKYMNKLTACPKEFEDRLFPLLFGASEYANMSVEKQMQVTKIMRTELDILAAKNYARQEGLAEGRAQGLEEGRAQGLEEGRVQGLEEGRAQGRTEGRAEGLTEAAKALARNLRDLGVPLSIIRQATGLSDGEIRAL